MTIDIREPRYYLVKHHLLRLIETLEPGEAIPTERELAAELDTSRGSVRRAIVELVAEGRLVRRQGSGTYVAEPKLAWPLYLSSFTEQAAVHGLTTSSQLLAAGRISADRRTSERLGVAPGTSLFKIERLRCASGEPVALEASHLVASRFPQLTRHIRQGHSLYAVLTRVYGVRLDQARQSIETAPASPREAALLAADSGAAMLILARQSFDQDGRPVEWVTSLYRGDRITFVANLTAPIAG